MGVFVLAQSACGGSMCGTAAPHDGTTTESSKSAVTRAPPANLTAAQDAPAEPVVPAQTEAAPCKTPFAAWPALCREDLPPALHDFAEPALPKFGGHEMVVRKHTDLLHMPNGSRVNILSDWKDSLFQINGSDLDYVIADGVTVEAMIVDNCKRCRVRGAGPNSRIKYLFVNKSSDVTIDSVLVKSDLKFNPLAVDLHDSERVALISSLFHSPYSAAMFAHGIQSLLIVNDWGSRFASTNDLVIVDSQIESRGLQPVLRRSGESSRHFYLRTTTINLYSGEVTFDLGGENNDAYDMMYQRASRYYVSNLSKRYDSLRFGGTQNDDGRRGVYEITDAVWITPDASEGAVHVTDAKLAEREAPEWRYRLGKPVYSATLKGNYEQRHPEWPVRVSRTLGKALSVANPYAL